MEVHQKTGLTDKPFTRRQWTRWVLTSCLGAVCFPPTVYAQAENSRLMLAVDEASSLVHLPVLLAQQLGYFKAEGLDVTLDQGNGSGAAVPLVANGTYEGVYQRPNFKKAFVRVKKGETIALFEGGA